MKNIGIVVDNDFNNDIRVRKEVEILKKNGYKLHVLCFAFDGKEYAGIDGVKISRIAIKKRTKDTLFFFFNRLPFYELLWKNKIVRFIKENNIDVIHAHDLYMAKAAHDAIYSLKLRTPLILDLHENFPYAVQAYNWTKGWLRHTLSYPEAWLKKEKKYLQYADKIVVLSETFKQTLLQRYVFLEAHNIVTFLNIIDLRRFEQYKIDPSVKKSDKVTLMYFGGVAERRGIFETLDVFEKALEQKLNVDLLIIGPLDKADKHKFLQKINKPNVRDSITYISWIDVSELVTYMNISDILLSPLIKNEQHESGLANKIFQYMYGAKPLIVSDCKPQKEIVKKFNCGLSYTTPDEYLQCITHLVDNPKLRTTLGINGYKKLYENFDNVAFENILIQLYKQLND